MGSPNTELTIVIKGMPFRGFVYASQWEIQEPSHFIPDETLSTTEPSPVFKVPVLPTTGVLLGRMLSKFTLSAIPACVQAVTDQTQDLDAMLTSSTRGKRDDAGALLHVTQMHDTAECKCYDTKTLPEPPGIEM